MFTLIRAWTIRLLSDVGSPKPCFYQSIHAPFSKTIRGLLMSKKKLHKLPQHEVIRVFEGFAGYGGASFGLRRSGLNYQVIGMSEFNPFACKLLEANFPEIRNWGDITKINPKELPDFDMFTGGFPCQPFSSAGMQMGEDDRYGRGTLFYEIMRILKEKRPRYLLLENVKGFTAKKFEPTRNRIKEILRELGYGELQYAVLNSCDYGIPQNRAYSSNCRVISSDRYSIAQIAGWLLLFIGKEVSTFASAV